MSADRLLAVYRAATALVVLVILLALGFGWHDCRLSGGQYVRGLFWMECIR